MNDQSADTLTPNEAGGAFADALTFVRIIVSPIIMALIIWRWPETQIALFATFLFIVAALTDIFDDFFGGAARSAVRRFGWMDDTADTILIIGALSALSLVLFRAGLLAWTFSVPVAIIILRELTVGFVKGGALRRYGWDNTLWSNLKGGFAMLGTALLVASPWLTPWIDRSRATADNVMQVYSTGSPMVWIAGQVALWFAALFSIISGFRILTHDFSQEED